MADGGQKRSVVPKALDTVERVGNRLPGPTAIFLILTGAVVLVSALCGFLGLSITHDFLDRINGEITKMAMEAVSLLAPDSTRYMVTAAVPNFTGFFALGTVFTIVMGVGATDGTGFMSTLLYRVASSTPKSLATTVMVFLEIMSNVASSTDYVILVPLGAILFTTSGRHPAAGLATAFAGVSGGWSADLLIDTNDPVFTDMSIQAVHMIDPEYTVLSVCNWYFMVVSTVLVTIIGTLVADRLVESHLGPWGLMKTGIIGDIGENEKRRMGWAGITASVYAAVMALLTVLPGGLLRDPQTHSLLNPPFMDGIIFLMMFLFLLPGLAYGIRADTLKNNRDTMVLVNKSISGLTGFMVLIFFTTQFTACFNYSNLSIIISVEGADFLQSVGLTGPPLIVCFILLTACINILIAVDSAKQAITAPIFVLMFMHLSLSPELTRAAYRIKDSNANIIAPLMPFFVLTVTLFRKYDRDAGIGSITSTILPYLGTFLLEWIMIFTVWYLTGLPLGPGSPLFYGLQFQEAWGFVEGGKGDCLIV